MATPAQGNDAASATRPRGSIAFVIPPPVTLWFQFSDGAQVSMTPTPERIASTIMGLPITGGMPLVMIPGLEGLFGGGNMQDDGLARAIHDLFMRSQSEQHGPPPTSKDFLDKIPLKTWTNQLKETEKYTDCSICLCDYEENDEVLPLPCGHQFHKDCGMKWLVEHNLCPTCRYALPIQESSAAKPPATTPSASPATSSTSDSEPEQEPATEEEPVRTQSRVRQRSPVRDPNRTVRRRISEMDSLVLPGSVSSSEDAALDCILEEEANRFIAEERTKQHQDELTFDEIDVEELLQDSSN